MRLNTGFFVPFFCVVLGACSSPATRELAPPFAHLVKPVDSVTVDATRDQVVALKGGMSIEVPAGAFTDLSGKAITTPVTLTVEHYNDAASILASGIPMKYDEGGVERDFESAGMLQVQGYSDGNKVKIASGKKLSINYPTTARGTYDLFYFEETPGSTTVTASFWPFGGKKGNSKGGAWKKLTNYVKAPDTAKKIKDFKLKFNTNKYPELAGVQSLNWHLATTYCDPTSAQNRRIMDQEWSSVHLSKPKKALKEVSVPSAFGQSYFWGNVLYSGDYSLISVFNNSVLTVWNTNTNKNFTVENAVCTVENDQDDEIVGARVSDVEFLANSYLIVNTKNGYVLVDSNGKSITNLGSNLRDYKFSLKNNRLGYERIIDAGLLKYQFYLIDFGGKKILDLPIEGQYESFADDYHFLLAQHGRIIINNSTSVMAYNETGDVIDRREGKYYNLSVLRNGNVLYETGAYEFGIWDYNHHNELKMSAQYTNYDNNFRYNLSDCDDELEKIQRFPYMVVAPKVNDSFRSCIYNYETNTYESVPFLAQNNALYTSTSRNPLIYGPDREFKVCKVYDVEQHKMLCTIPMHYAAALSDSRYSIPYNDKTGAFLLNFGSIVQLRDKAGNLIRDFAKYDSGITDCFFLSDDGVCAVSDRGVIYHFDKAGVMVAAVSKAVERYDGYFADLVAEQPDKIYRFDKVADEIKVYTSTGELEKSLTCFGFKELNKNLVLIGDETGANLMTRYRVYELADVPENAWQLEVRNDSIRFWTYVYPDGQTTDAVEQYEAYLSERRKTEEKRVVEEGKLMRRFEIEQFGIYNWDRMMKQENTIQFAATFNFDTSARYSDVKVYLITKIDGNAVVVYDKASWGVFSINPSAQNKIVAILPGNKMAVYSPEDMKKINWADVKQNKRFTFDMKTLPQSIDSLKKLEEYL